MSFTVRNDHAWCRRNRPLRIQHFLKAFAGAAGALIVAPELFRKRFVAMDNTLTAFDAGFRREPFSALTHDLESLPRLRSWLDAFS
jgi:hypothetical protein